MVILRCDHPKVATLAVVVDHVHLDGVEKSISCLILVIVYSIAHQVLAEELVSDLKKIK